MPFGEQLRDAGRVRMRQVKLGAQLRHILKRRWCQTKAILLTPSPDTVQRGGRLFVFSLIYRLTSLPPCGIPHIPDCVPGPHRCLGCPMRPTTRTNHRIGWVHGEERQQFRMTRHLELHGEIIRAFGVIGRQAVDLDGLFLLGEAPWTHGRIPIPVRRSA